MKRTALLGFILTLFLLEVARTAVSVEIVEVSMAQETAPDFTLTDIDGNVFSLSDYRGTVVLLEFFATWCSASVNQTAHLKVLYEEFDERLVVISISPENETVLRDFREEHGIEWTIANDTANVFEAYEVLAIPVLVIIDQQGYICCEHVGLTQESVLRSEIETLLSKTIYVDGDNIAGPWNGTEEHPYQNITSALEHASDNDIVFVQNGTYHERVTINKSISLIGENRINTIIDGSFTGTVINVTASNVNITGFTIRNSEYLFPYCGIYVGEGSVGSKISSNIIANNWFGIWLYDSSSNSISENNVIDNYEGISMLCSGSNVLKNNHITGNCYSFSVWGTDLSHFIQDIDTSNNVNGKPIFYLVNQHDREVPADTGYVGIVNSTNVLVKNLKTAKNTQGILLAYTRQSTIENVNVSHNMNGIVLWRSRENTICDSTISSNLYHGISVAYSSDNAISDNTVSNNNYGVYLDGSFNNRFYHNNFINNTQHVHVRISVINYWDKGVEGNCWNDYNGADLQSGTHQNETGSDGIGDTRYDIDENNQDNYPLMGMFSDFDATLEHRVETICNSTISDFQFNGTAISFNVTGDDGTVGFCRICVPTAVMNETYSVFVNGTKVPHTLLLCSNYTHSYMYFTYSHSTLEVVIIPEFPSVIILSLFMMTTLLGAIVCGRNDKK